MHRNPIIDCHPALRAGRRTISRAALLFGLALIVSCTTSTPPDAASPAASESAASRSPTDDAATTATAATSAAADLEHRLVPPTASGDGLDPSPINAVSVDLDGRVATAATNGSVVVYQPTNDESTPIALIHPEGHVDSVTFEPDGGRLATGIAQRRTETSFDDTLSVWNVATADRLIEVGGEAEEVAGCAFFRNIVRWANSGEFVASTSHDFTVAIIDPDTGESLHSFAPHANTILATAISPDDRWLVTSGDDSSMRVWDLESTELVAEHQVTMGGYWSMEFLPDGSALVVSDLVGNLQVIDPFSGEITMSFEGRKQRKASIAVSPDGRILAAGADGSAVRMWSTATGKPLADFDGHDAPVTSVAFFADGERMVTGSQDGSAIVWRYDVT